MERSIPVYTFAYQYNYTEKNANFQQKIFPPWRCLVAKRVFSLYIQHFLLLFQPNGVTMAVF